MSKRMEDRTSRSVQAHVCAETRCEVELRNSQEGRLGCGWEELAQGSGFKAHRNISVGDPVLEAGSVVIDQENED